MGMYHVHTPIRQKIVNKEIMRERADGEILSAEQRNCASCGCENCLRLFEASTRWMQNIADRTEAFKQMSR